MKKLAYVLIGLVGLSVVAAVIISLVFDPNDYRDEIAAEVKRETGRDLVIEGDLELTFFPWFGVSIGKTTLGNAPGFGDEPFLSFEEARTSLQVMPLLRGDSIEFGSIVLDSLKLNLEIAADGTNNWADIVEHKAAQEDVPPEVRTDAEAAEQAAEEVARGQEVTLNIASVEITNAAVSYADAQAGESYSLTNFNLVTGRLGGSDPIDVESSFDFEVQPAGIAGDFSVETAIIPAEGGIMLDDARISTLGIDVSVADAFNAEGFAVHIDAFSLKALMTRLGVEPPVTADPDALGKIIFDGKVRLGDTVAIDNVELVVDDTTFTGGLSFGGGGAIGIQLAGDSIDLDRYMEPAADAEAASGDAVPVEIPVDLIRALNVRGKMTLDAAQLSGLEFENVELGLNVADGNMRLHPISAGFFDGKYQGDVRINAAGDVPVLSVDENINGVQLGALALAMFDQQNITGTINGRFKLGGLGQDLAAIQRSLDGSISMELLDGAFEGTDVWYELRRARALYRQEPAPEPKLPARTQFSTVKVTGPVNDGVFSSDDLLAELPFMRLTGKGKVNFPTAEIDYRMTARILDKPELVDAATEAELADLTEAVIPLRVSGALASPKIAPDIEEMLKEEVREKVEEEIKDKLLKKLLGDDG
jgi:AsmA protein